MKNYIALDSGGTKVLAILYDECFRPLKICRVGSLRKNSTSEEIVLRNIEELIDGLGIRGKRIEYLSGVFEPWTTIYLNKVCTIERVYRSEHGELEAGMGAALLFGDGVLALAGTGATSHVRYGEKVFYAGGYGPLISDAGSGYWIGRRAMEAAIGDFEGWKEKTVLTDMIAEKNGVSRENFSEGVHGLYLKTDKSLTCSVADCASLVTKAAEIGDRIALGILEEAGYILGKQITALVEKTDVPRDIPVTVSGSVWRSHPILLQNFERVLREAGLCNLILPIFEPIVGVIIQHYYRENGTFDDTDREKFLRWYHDYVFKIS